MKTYIRLLFFILFSSAYAQTTAIPDEAFEQALIDLGIDSDETINGQVLTSDIAVVDTLDLDGVHIKELTGIEDFSFLKVLDISHTGLYNDTYPVILELTSVESLEELYINGDADGGGVAVNYLDLSNNPNLKKITAIDNWSLTTINLKGSDLSLHGLLIENTEPICIEVSNPTQAQNGEGIYATWNAGGDFSSDCNNLSTESFTSKDIDFYPNPVKHTLYIKAKQGQVKKASLYDLQGRLLRTVIVESKIDVHDLPTGLYLIELTGEYGTVQKKFVKE